MFEWHSQIENYINGKLSPEDSTAFEQALKDDADLKAVYEERIVYSHISDELINESISQEIKKLQEEEQNKKSASSKSLVWLAIVLLLTLLAFVYLLSRPSLGEQLYNKYYANLQEESSRGENNKENKTNIKNCDQGHAYMQAGKFDQALTAFSQHLDSKDLLCKEKVLFHLALIKIKQGDIDQALAYLKQIEAMEDYGYHRAAMKLMQELSE